jgi:deoxyribodipyrimidine photo-lyase
MTKFTTNYKEILEQVENIDPISYSRSRNFLNGKVTMLSPYLTHGVISLNQVKKSVLAKYKYSQVEKLIFELAWKEYFLRVWENKKDEIWTDIKRPQDSTNELISKNILEAKTGIQGIDNQILQLYEMGYMHNHARMWTASISTNIAKSHWVLPSKWLYYHLLDGDLASNTLSWQWVAGTFSSKKYFANQENINKYANTKQLGTYLDVPYESIDSIAIPKELNELENIELKTNLEEWVGDYLQRYPQLPKCHPELVSGSPTIGNDTTNNQKENLIIFHPWMLDPNFGSDIENVEKVLMLEPSHFQSYPMSQKRIEFILDLAQNIPGLQIFVGEVTDLPLSDYKTITTRKYPAIDHWKNIPNIEIRESDYMFPTVSGYFGSFMGYWKMCEKVV